jgi:hypothetical protein
MNRTLTADPRRAQERAERLLGLALAGVVIFALVTLVVFWHGRRAEVSSLPAGGGPLAEALQWPWPGFPAVQPVEEETIQRDFRLGEPLLVHELRPYLDVPESLRPSLPEARRDLDTALGALRSLFAHPAGDPGSESPAAAQTFDAGVSALTRAANRQGSWVVLYDRGLLYLWKGSARSAVLDLRAAMQTLAPRLTNLPVSSESRAALLEAAVHTDYALGLALLDWAASAQAPAHKTEAIHSLRESVRLLQPLWETRTGPYAAVARPLGFFNVRPTGLPTSALANDLVAAYLASPDFHDCSTVPAELPCTSPRKRGACVYRDKVFCLSLERASGPFAAPFTELAHRFYSGKLPAWNEEFRLWALSNAVDRSAENLSLDDPRLLYNFGSLLLEVGALSPAATLLDQAADGLGRAPSLRDEDVERVERLATVSRVLAGLEPQAAPRSAAAAPKTSTLRALYQRLHPEGADGAPHAFPAVGKSFSPDAEATVDAWLFVRAWRQQLERGDFDGFERDYRRTLSERDLPQRDFFRLWHTEVTSDLGERALSRATVLEGAGEVGEARRIRLFVGESGSFPAPLAAQARQGWRLAGRRLGFWIVVVLLVAIVGAAAVLLPGLAIAHRTLFLSAYRAGRIGKERQPAPASEPPPGVAHP